MNFDQMSAATGMPRGKKPTHRGRRSRGHGMKPVEPPHVEHLAAVNEAMAAEDHPAAKSAALSLVNALHALTKKNAAPPMGPSDAMPLGDTP